MLGRFLRGIVAFDVISSFLFFFIGDLDNLARPQRPEKLKGVLSVLFSFLESHSVHQTGLEVVTV